VTGGSMLPMGKSALVGILFMGNGIKGCVGVEGEDGVQAEVQEVGLDPAGCILGL
jgi:hypothetical protein